MKRTFILFIVPLFCLSHALNAQISHGGQPLSFSQPPLKSMAAFYTPDFDYQQLIKEGDAEAGRSKPFRYGKTHEVSLNPYISGTWSKTVNGEGIWQLRINSRKAFSISLIFNIFRLNERVKLFIYSPDKKQVIGSFTDENNIKSAWFSTIPLAGEEIIIELNVPANQEFGELNISGIVHDYKNAFGLKTGYGASGSCNVNINCPDGANWQNEKRSVVKYSYSVGGTTELCTGVLINNTAYNAKPYLLTAGHCIGSQAVANTAVFMFNYESANCIATGNPSYQSISSATLLATGGNLDFTLLELSTNPPPTYNAYYAGWNRGTSPAQNTVTIHHPQADIKKISKDFDPPIFGNYVGYLPNSHWNIVQWDIGTTEGGSSGSPLFDQNHRIVGGLTGGDASCSFNFNDYYERFDISWDYHTEQAKQLKAWLDPLNTGILTLDGFDPNAISAGVDIGVIEVKSPNGVFCSGNEIVPEVIVQNRGTIDLTSAIINYKLNDGSVISKVWNGNLKTLETANIIFNSILSPSGNVDFKTYTSAPNSVADNNFANDTLISSFYADEFIDNVQIDGPKEICSQSLNGIYSVKIPGKYLWQINGGTVEDTTITQSISVIWDDWGVKTLNLNVTNLCNSMDAETFEIDILEQTLDLQINTGNIAASVCWSIKDCDGNIVSQDCGLEPNIDYSTKICLRSGCYRFNLSSQNLGVNKYSLTNAINRQVIFSGSSIDGSFSEEFIMGPSKNFAKFNVYPNPAQSKLVIEGNFVELYSDSKFAIYKLDGAMVIPYNNLDERKEIDISTLPKGMYIIEIVTNRGKFSKKFVKP